MRSSSGAEGRSSAGGFLTVQFVLAVGFSLVLLVLCANLIVWQYGRGVVRAALDEGARTGARWPISPPACEERAAAALDDLLGGALRAGVTVRCGTDGRVVVAEADATLPGWLPGVPDLTFTSRASATAERLP